MTTALRLILITLFTRSAVSFSHESALPVEIYDFVLESDVVLTGVTVKGRWVSNPSEQNSARFYTVRADNVLYATPEIRESIFSTDDLNQINETLKRKKNTDFLIFTRGKASISGPSFPAKYTCLFFLKVSDFPTEFPDSYLDGHMDRFSHGQQVSRSHMPVASLNEEFFFEPTYNSIDCTRNLKLKHQKNWLPYTETLGAALSIPNQARKEERLRELTHDKDPILAQNAQGALLRVSPTEKARRRARMIEMARKGRESAEQK